MLKLDIQRFADERPYYTSGVLIDEEALYEYHDKMKTYLANNIPDELADLSDDATHRLVTDTEKTTWNSKSDFSGSYNDLTNKPDIPEVGNSKVYYGTSDTGASTQAKVVVSSDYVLEEGNTIFVKFTNAQTYNGTATLNVNSTGAKNITRVGTTTTSRYWWTAGEVVGFVYDGTNYVMIDKGAATTSYYGLTKLSSAINSTSTSLAATPSAVKAAYDLADSKQDEITSSNKLDYSLISNTPTIPTVPTNVSSFTNDAGYITSSYHDSSKQDTLVSGTNIKTINNQSLLGSGNINISSGGGTATDVQINGSSIVSSDVANILVDGTYSSSNKIATMSSLPTVPTNTSDLTNDGDGHLGKKYAITPYDGNGIQVEYYGNKWHIWGLNNYANVCEAAILDDVGDIDTLTTTDKSSIVAAINEVNSQGTVLYDNTGGSYVSSINLNDSADNYTYLEIYYYYYGHSSMKAIRPNNSYINISQVVVASSYIFWVVAYWNVSGTTMTKTTEERWRLGTSGSGQRTQNPNNLIVEKVIGYK